MGWVSSVVCQENCKDVNYISSFASDTTELQGEYRDIFSLARDTTKKQFDKINL